MKLKCSAVVENPVQRDNLCQCIRILGGEPVEYKDKVSVEYEGTDTDKFIQLFEHYVRHEIHTCKGNCGECHN